MEDLKINIVDRGENGNPLVWEIEINSSQYGEKCWISDNADNPAEFTIFISDSKNNKWKDLKTCCSLEEATKWIKDNLCKQ